LKVLWVALVFMWPSVTESFMRPGGPHQRPQALVGATVARRETMRPQTDAQFFSATDTAYMREAIELAASAAGRTAPNPTVGCVVVARNGTVLGRGFHPAAGM